MIPMCLCIEFLPKVLPNLNGLGKSLLDGLAVRASSEGVGQAVKAIVRKKVAKSGGIFLKTGGEKEGDY